MTIEHDCGIKNIQIEKTGKGFRTSEYSFCLTDDNGVKSAYDIKDCDLLKLAGEVLFSLKENDLLDEFLESLEMEARIQILV